MLNLNYLKRLTLHGSRLVWRVLMIFLPVVGYSFWQAIKGVAGASDSIPEEKIEHGLYSDGSPWLENTSHPQWEAYYGDHK